MSSLLNRVLNRNSLYWQRPLSEYVWVVLLYPFSGVVRAALLLLPFRWLSPCLGVHYRNVELSTLVAPLQCKRAWRIGRVVEFACRYTPWESKCLVQALLASVLLQYYRIPYALYLGVGRPPESGIFPCADSANNKLQAHAWVKVGPAVVTGRAGHSQYAVVSTFLSPFLQLPAHAA